MKKNLFVAALCVLFITGCSVSVNNNSKDSETKVNNSNTQVSTKTDSNVDKNQNTVTENTISTIVFDKTKAINTDADVYTLSSYGNAGMSANVSDDNKKLVFAYTPMTVVNYYSLNWTSDKQTMNTSVVEFDKKIVDLFFGGFGQSNQGDTLFILLEDGTVEYIPIVHMFNHAQGAPVSYGKLEGVTGVVKFASANVPDAFTTIAIKGDGSFYDLGKILYATGNY